MGDLELSRSIAYGGGFGRGHFLLKNSSRRSADAGAQAKVLVVVCR
jgi:hypothetical protein